jgi:hypothetical protein
VTDDAQPEAELNEVLFIFAQESSRLVHLWNADGTVDALVERAEDLPAGTAECALIDPTGRSPVERAVVAHCPSCSKP